MADEAHVVDRLALRPAEAAAALGISVRRLRQIAPQIPHVRIADTILFPVPELRRWLSEKARTAVETAGPAPVVPDEADPDAVVREILEKLG